MKKLLSLAVCTVAIMLNSCEFITVSTTFDAPFPKRNRNLSNILGDELTIKSGNDTLELKISSTRTNNLITNSQTGDTLFYGKVTKFRGLYYFSERLDDTSCFIYAVKISDKLIYGLNTGWTQMSLAGEEIKKGNNKLLRYINSDSTTIRLHPDKYEMKKLFGSIINKIDPDTILNFKEEEVEERSNFVMETNSEELDYISKAYPNPTKDFVTINLQQKENSSFQLTDLRGNILKEGKINTAAFKIDLSKEQAGIYMLTMINASDKEKETIKIVKVD